MKKLLFEAEFNTKKAEKDIISLTQAIDKNKKQLRELEAQIKKDGVTTTENAKRKVALKRQISENTTELKQNEKAVQASNNLQKQGLKVSDDVAGAYARLSDQLNKSRAAYKDLAAAGQGNTDQAIKLKEEVNALDSQLKELDSGVGQSQRNVGNYTSALEGLSPQFGKVSQGIKGVNLQFLKLLANPIVAIIAAIVGAFILLASQFTKTQANADQFNRVMAQIGGVINMLAVRVSKLGGAIVAFLSRDFTRASQLAEEATNDLTDSIINQLNASGKLFDREKKLIAQRNRFTVSQSKLNMELEKYSTIADDSTRTLQEMERAAIKAGQIRAKISQANLDMAQKELDFTINKANEDRDFSDTELKSIAELAAARNQAAADSLRVQMENAKQLRQIRLDEFELELDFLIDSSDNQKTINERIIADTSIALLERKKLFEETTQIVNSAFQSEIELFEKQTGMAIDQQKALSLNNKELYEYAKSLGLVEIESTRFLETIRERRTFLNDLAEAERDLAKEELDLLNSQFKAYNEYVQNKISLDLQGLEAEKASLEASKEVNQNYASEIAEINERIRQAKIEGLEEATNSELVALQEQLEANQITQEEYRIRELIAVENFEANKTSILKEGLDKRNEIEELSAEMSIQAASKMATGILSIFRGFAEEGSSLAKALATTETLVNTVTEVGLIWLNAQKNPLAGVVPGLAQALAAVETAGAVTRGAMRVQQINAAAGGGDFITSKPTMMLVGDNPGGRERVTVEPLSGKGQTRINPASGITQFAGGGSMTVDRTMNNVSGVDSMAIIKAFRNMPNPRVSIIDYKETEDRYNQVKAIGSV